MKEIIVYTSLPITEYLRLSARYAIPLDDVLIIDIKRNGICLNNNSMTYEGLDLNVEFNNRKFTSYISEQGCSSFSYYIGILSFDMKPFTNAKILNMYRISPLYHFRDPKDRSVMNINPLTKCPLHCHFCSQHKRGVIPRIAWPDKIDKCIATIIRHEGREVFKNVQKLFLVTAALGSENDAIDFCRAVLKSIHQIGFRGKCAFASHEVQTREGMERLSEFGVSHFIFPIEHFSRRREYMEHKGNMDISEIEQLLGEANLVFPTIEVYYIIGIDSREVLRAGFQRISPLVTRIVPTILRINRRGMTKIRCADAEQLEYYVEGLSFIRSLNDDEWDCISVYRR